VKWDPVLSVILRCFVGVPLKIHCLILSRRLPTTQ
jgi:hypothetical protein